MKNMGLGLIGTGGRGTGMAARAREVGFEIQALADHNPVRLEAAAEDLEVPGTMCFEDYSQLLVLDAIEAVIIATPDHVHAPPALAALKNGKHVYCEKAMATTTEDCADLVRAAEEAWPDQVFYVGHNMRFNDACGRVHEMIRAGEIGEVKLVWGRRFVEGAKYWHRWHRYRENSGGLLVHKGSHVMDLINWNAGSNPKQVAAFGGLDVYRERPDAPRRCRDCPERRDCPYEWTIDEGKSRRYYLDAEEEDGYIWDTCIYYPGSDVFDNATVNIAYENGVRGTYMECHFVPISDRHSEIGAVGDRGMVIGYPGRREVIVEKTHSREVVRHEFPARSGGHGGADEKILADFRACIQEGLRPESDVRAGWNSAVLGIAAQQSAAEGRMIDLDADRLSIG